MACFMDLNDLEVGKMPVFDVDHTFPDLSLKDRFQGTGHGGSCFSCTDDVNVLDFGQVIGLVVDFEL